MNTSEIAFCRIHPAIGIARVGNSPTAYFIGPEAPGVLPETHGGYKDALGRVKRQAARFRVFAYAKDGSPRGELAVPEAKITWSVHLANKKGSWYQFKGRFKLNKNLRNGTIQGGAEFVDDPDLRSQLIVDPGARAIAGVGQGPVPFDGGKFLELDVPLGELRTDAHGRLLVLGGAGTTRMAKGAKDITNFANNDFWCDDVSDGPVSASVELPDGKSLKVEGAWVIVAPPKFAPALTNLVSLYEVMRDVAIDQKWLPAPSDGVSFFRDIYPILRRAGDLAWVNDAANRGHGPSTNGRFLRPDVLALLADPGAKSAMMRQEILKRVRVPAALADSKTRQHQASSYYMPQLSGDAGDCTQGEPDTFLTVLPSQYRALAAWAQGKFVTGTPPEKPVPFAEIPLAQQPAALDRAALEPCVGGPFYPGIEMTFIANDPATYSGAFRIAAKSKPGDITRWMAMPWQADFYECAVHWWPAQRPDDVVPFEDFEEVSVDGKVVVDDGHDKDIPVATALAGRAAWARGLSASSPAGDNDMVRYWSELGFVVPKTTSDGEVVQVETERLPLAGMDARELFYQLMNVDDFPGCLPKARQFADYWLRWAEEYSNADDTPHSFKFFRYSESTLRARLSEIYQDLVDDARNSSPSTNAIFKTRADMIERTRQLAPFNLTDGAWLRNIGMTGPIDEVRSLLYQVAMDEMGDGDVAHNHCNLYRDLCQQMGLYLPPVNSREFAADERFLDSAFTIPTLELAVSQFSHRYYPELMGFTLQLEWTVVDLKPTRDLLTYFGFDPHYYVMHIGIDNADSGHGAMALRAIKLYLDDIRANGGGEQAVQQQWRRIWNGFVAFGAAGSFGQDLADLLTKRPSLEDQVIELIEKKAPYARLNHGTRTLGPNLINDWFADPPGFLKALVTYGKIVPGDWDNSPLKTLLGIETGPMYRVFTDPEVELLANYTRSLVPTRKPEPPPAPLPTKDPARAMAGVIDYLRPQQVGEVAHRAQKLADASGAAHSVTWWFQQPTRDFMAALADKANGFIVPGDTAGSRFLTQLIAPAGPMGSAFSQEVDGSGGKSCRDVATEWIQAGCPLPPAMPDVLKVLRLNSPRPAFAAHPTGKLVGNATVH